ncbi:MAG: FapA family protein [Proteobacteria bacterium]|nr:FapA family protein [Pseudomonadota bacterium]MBU4296020.1 FapA family protein [Pseudomonadota bacterium]MCG2747270.1 FapA family protein [Desulfobulbaceae bacterium]
MSPAKKKSFESLEDAYLKALDLDEKPEEEKDRPSSTQDQQDLTASLQRVKAWQGKELLLSPDNMSVTLVLTGGEPITATQIKLALEQSGIIYGISPGALQKVEEISRSPEKTGKFLLAAGTHPQISRRITFPFLTNRPDAGHTMHQAAAELDCAALQNLFSAPDLIAVHAAALLVKAVNAGEVLLKIQENPDAQPGRDIYGHEIECIAEPLPGGGDNVVFNVTGWSYEATAYGYLLVAENTLSVLPPLWITADRNAAYYLCLPQLAPCRYPTTIDISEMLLKAGIHEKCIDPAAIENMVAQMAAGLTLPRTIKLAETVQPLHGHAATFSLSFDAAKKAGALRHDGSLDLRERNAVVSVSADTLIAEKNLATIGVAGCTLFGKPIKATPGVDKKISIGQGVRVEEKKDVIRYFAEKNGNVKFSKNTLAVQDIFEISGDIDYSTGNINVKTDLLIKGSVLRGFTVKSEGDIAIMGAVENGATVIAMGNLTVDKGIIGENSKVVSRGNLRTGYIQDAEVIVKGDVIIGSYLFNCMLIASGSITVLREQGQKRSGRVVGGIICSAKGIRLSTIGSPGKPGTVVALRTDPEIVAGLKKLEEQLLSCTSNITKISRSLPFDSFDAGQIKAALARIPAAKRDGLVLLLTNLNKLIKHRKTLSETMEQLRSRIDLSLHNARIEVIQEIFQGSEIHIGGQHFIIPQDMGPSLFKLHDGKIIRA